MFYLINFQNGEPVSGNGFVSASAGLSRPGLRATFGNNLRSYECRKAKKSVCNSFSVVCLPFVTISKVVFLSTYASTSIWIMANYLNRSRKKKHNQSQAQRIVFRRRSPSEKLICSVVIHSEYRFCDACSLITLL